LQKATKANLINDLKIGNLDYRVPNFLQYQAIDVFSSLETINPIRILSNQATHLSIALQRDQDVVIFLIFFLEPYTYNFLVLLFAGHYAETVNIVPPFPVSAVPEPENIERFTMHIVHFGHRDLRWARRSR